VKLVSRAFSDKKSEVEPPQASRDIEKKSQEERKDQSKVACAA
jgi:hypothetical protein